MLSLKFTIFYEKFEVDLDPNSSMIEIYLFIHRWHKKERERIKDLQRFDLPPCSSFSHAFHQTGHDLAIDASRYSHRRRGLIAIISKRRASWPCSPAACPLNVCVDGWHIDVAAPLSRGHQEVGEYIRPDQAKAILMSTWVKWRCPTVRAERSPCTKL
jgi:hypothetical protein